MEVDRLAEIRQRVEAVAVTRPEHWRAIQPAGPGSVWEVDYPRGDDPNDDRERYDLFEDPSRETVEFAAAARRDVRFLLAALDEANNRAARAEAQRDEARKALEVIHAGIDQMLTPGGCGVPVALSGLAEGCAARLAEEQE